MGWESTLRHNWLLPLLTSEINNDILLIVVDPVESQVFVEVVRSRRLASHCLSPRIERVSKDSVLLRLNCSHRLMFILRGLALISL